jgi:hypothetical protein
MKVWKAKQKPIRNRWSRVNWGARGGPILGVQEAVATLHMGGSQSAVPTGAALNP